MLEPLKIFGLVARYQSFTRAADAAGLTRPAISQIIKQLEQEYGVPLFARSTRQVTLTPAGEVLLAQSERVLAAYSELEAAMGALRRDHRDVLVIGASTLPGESLLPPVLAAYRRENPTLEVQVRQGNTEAVLQMVRQGHVAVGLVGQAVDDPQLIAEPVAEDEVVLALPPALDLPDPLPPAQLATLPVILRERGSATRAVVAAALAQHGVTLQNVVAELGSPEAIRAAVRSGMGIGFLSRSALIPSDLRTVRIAGVALKRPICAVWRRDRTPEPAARTLVTLLAQVAHGN
jgi:DNA-binding transcriptional LysR family regulator